MAGYYDETDSRNEENEADNDSLFNGIVGEDDDDLDDGNNDETTDYLEEAGAETAPFNGADVPDDRAMIDDDDRGWSLTDNGTGYGILALVLSIAAFFFLPVVMGAAGIIIGFIARSKGAGAWGGWAIGVGIAALAVRLFMAPFF